MKTLARATARFIPNGNVRWPIFGCHESLRIEAQTKICSAHDPCQLRPLRLLATTVRTPLQRSEVRPTLELLNKNDEEESPTKAETRREWSPDAHMAMLKWLSDVVHEQPNSTAEIELWRVRKGERELRCLAVYLPSGIDVRLFEGTTSAAHNSCASRLP